MAIRTSRPVTTTAIGAAAACAAAVVGGCGGAAAQATASTTTATPSASAHVDTACATTAGAVLEKFAARVYVQAESGRNVADVRRRLSSSPALDAAIAAGSPARTHAALVPLLKHQVTRLRITHGHKTLVAVGATNALGPTTIVLRNRHSGASDGTITYAVAPDAAIAGLLHSLTGATVTMTAAGTTVAHAGDATATDAARTVTLVGTAFPQGPLAIRLTLPTIPTSWCGASDGATRALTTAAVGKRLYAVEAESTKTQRVLRHVAHDRPFLRAVASDDASAMRRRVIHFFRDRSLHVVRIRATDARGALVGDIGGPYVLAPASAPLRAGGHTIGHVTLSVQDDTGYIKLLHRFTGAEVALRTAAGAVVPGGNVPRPGHRYFETTYPVTGFPSGPLTVTLLTPAANA